MAAPKRGPRLGGGPAHQKLMLSNLASDLFRHGRIKTTEAKAKTLRPYAEKLITKAKAGDLPARRQVLSKLRDRDVVAYLFEEVAPRFADRNGGYTRILKLGPRAGDNARMALIELVEQGTERGEEVIEESKQGRMRGLFGRRRRGSGEDPLAAGAGNVALADAATDTEADTELVDEPADTDDVTAANGDLDLADEDEASDDEDSSSDDSSSDDSSSDEASADPDDARS